MTYGSGALAPAGAPATVPPHEERENPGTLGLVPFGVSIWEILILLVVVLLLFGPKRLPEMGRSLGRGMREFKDSITGKDDEVAGELPRSTEQERVSGTREHDAAR